MNALYKTNCNQTFLSLYGSLSNTNIQNIAITSQFDSTIYITNDSSIISQFINNVNSSTCSKYNKAPSADIIRIKYNDTNRILFFDENSFGTNYSGTYFEINDDLKSILNQIKKI